MVTNFFTPANADKLTTETTLSLEREIGEHADVFVEYVGDYPDHSASQFLLNSGGTLALQAGSTFTLPSG